MKDITLRQLRFLTEVVRAGSLAGAAERLHLTGPAIAQQLRLLERAVGLSLLERGPTGQQPTEAGRLLVETAIRLDAELAVCDESLRSLRNASRGHVTLGAVSTAKYFAPHVLATFRQAHPGVQVSLHIGNRDDILARLADFRLDLALMGRPPHGLDVEHQVFGNHHYVMIAAPDHRLADRHEVALDALDADTLLVREQGSGTRQHLDALLTSAGIEPAERMELASNETIKQAAMAGLGVGLISADTVVAEVRDGRLVVLNVLGLPIHRHWLVVRMRRKAITPAGQALWDFVLARAAEQLPALEAPRRAGPAGGRSEYPRSHSGMDISDDHVRRLG
jgi:DNA-binding transcriptional LysR family regulator